jgi:oligopeptidase A
MHQLMSTVEVRSLAGTHVPWDFVELPSQIMENWCWEREALDRFARHYQTGEAIPQELFDKMKRAKTFQAAMAQMRQLSFGIMDLKLHMAYDPARDGDVVAYSRAILNGFSVAPLPPEHAMAAAFTHLFGDAVGYGAGYYSYKWAEVLSADAYAMFEEHGVLDPAVGRRFWQEILGAGGSRPAMESFVAFRGREPSIDALLRHNGMVAA